MGRGCEEYRVSLALSLQRVQTRAAVGWRLHNGTANELNGPTATTEQSCERTTRAALKESDTDKECFEYGEKKTQTAT